MKTFFFKSASEMRVALRDKLHERTATDLRKFGHATAVLSGGNTPKYYLPELANSHKNWNGISLTLSDERFVKLDHPDSNEALVRKYFSQTNANIIGLRGGSSDPIEAASIATKKLDTACYWPASLSILGFGLDGHFASLFSTNDYRRPIKDAVISTIQPNTKQNRLSMSFEHLLKTRKIIFVSSVDKFKKMEKMLSETKNQKSPLNEFIKMSASSINWFLFEGDNDLTMQLTHTTHRFWKKTNTTLNISPKPLISET